MSLLIGMHIASELKSCENVRRMIGYIDDDGVEQLRLYPIVAPEGAERPFVVYKNDGVVGEYTKDGGCGDTVVVHLRCVAEEYYDAVTLAQRVKDSLEGVTEDYELFTVKDCNLVGSDEAWLQEVDAYEVDVKLEFVTV